MSLVCILIFAVSADANDVELSEAAPKVEGKYASIVVDADTLEVIHARQIDALRYPASLTKVMTLFLVFDALEAGEITLDTEMAISKRAAKTAPVKVYLKTGQTITVRDAIQAIAVKSANDASVVVAEHLFGSVEDFTTAMNARAQSLGMKSTVFRTPNGLPDPEQVTTARDMAKLATAVLRTHPEHYHWFGQKVFKFRGATYKNTNGLLHSLPEVDGFKTGYTRASGYNLVISAEREDESGAERRIIAVVLGGASGKSRNAHMVDLIDKSFERLGIAGSSARERVVEVEPVAAPAPVINALSLRRSDGGRTRIVSGGESSDVAALGRGSWAVRVGRFADMVGARDQLGALFGMDPLLHKERAVIQPTARGFEARFTDLTFDQAESVCAQLAGLASGCSLIAPSRTRPSPSR